MGCSNPHPHGQVWSLSEVPQIPSVELANLSRYSSDTQEPSKSPKRYDGRPCLLCDYAHFEVDVSPEAESRVILKDDHWVALVPWWAVWPFETLGKLAL